MFLFNLRLCNIWKKLLRTVTLIIVDCLLHVPISLPQLFPCSCHHPMQLSSSAIFLSSLTFVFISPLSSLTTTTLRTPHISPGKLFYSCSVALLSSNWETADSLMIFLLLQFFLLSTHSLISTFVSSPPSFHSSTKLITYLISISNSTTTSISVLYIWLHFLGTVQCSSEIANTTVYTVGSLKLMHSCHPVLTCSTWPGIVIVF